MAKLLNLLKDVPDEKRTARFICHLCLASPEKPLVETYGSLEGIIIRQEQGTNGFGYDPVFYVPEMKKTVAEMTSEEKNKISHRARAIQNLKPLLNNLL